MPYRDLVCSIIERIAWLLPALPEGWSFINLANQLGESIPFVGSYLVYIFARDIFYILFAVVGYKMLKVLPVKL